MEAQLNPLVSDYEYVPHIWTKLIKPSGVPMWGWKLSLLLFATVSSLPAAQIYEEVEIYRETCDMDTTKSTEVGRSTTD